MSINVDYHFSIWGERR